jgi:uncharacterized protein (TIGR02678 family)
VTPPATGLADVLDRQQAEERRRALRALLRHPLLTRAGPDPAAFALVRRHAGWLREWLANNAGWSLQVDTGLARLRKLPGRLDDRTRPALAMPARAPFSRRRYVLACLALATLERADAQVTLGWLAERVLALAADPDLADAGFAFALDSREERADLVVVVRLLLGIGVLAKVAGDEQSFVNSSGDALYDVNRRVLAALLVTQRGPSMVAATDLEARLRAITEELVPDSEDGRNRAIRHALTRRLLDDPVLYQEELGNAERGYLTGQRTFLVRRLAEATGLVPEVRAEGWPWSTRPARQLTWPCPRRAPTATRPCCLLSIWPGCGGSSQACRSRTPRWRRGWRSWPPSIARCGARERPSRVPRRPCVAWRSTGWRHSRSSADARTG